MKLRKKHRNTEKGKTRVPFEDLEPTPIPFNGSETLAKKNKNTSNTKVMEMNCIMMSADVIYFTEKLNISYMEWNTYLLRTATWLIHLSKTDSDDLLKLAFSFRDAVCSEPASIERNCVMGDVSQF